MIYYHGTSAKRAGSILKTGLKPSPSLRNHEEGYYMGKRGESVFLASGWHDAHVWSRHATKADHFAGKMSFKESELAKFKAVLRVHIPNDPNTLAKLKQDEALGGEFYRFEGEIPPEWIKLAYHVED